MSLTDKNVAKDKKPSIKLIMSREVNSIDTDPFVSVDITDAVLKGYTDPITYRNPRLLGLTIDLEDVGMRVPFLHEFELHRGLENRINTVLDAVLVNEKQKEAVKAMVEKEINGAFNYHNKTFDVASKSA